MDFNQAKDAFIVILGSGVLYFLKNMLDTLKGMKTSVDTLNISMAVTINTTKNHDVRITNLEQKHNYNEVEL